MQLVKADPGSLSLLPKIPGQIGRNYCSCSSQVVVLTQDTLIEHVKSPAHNTSVRFPILSIWGSAMLQVEYFFRIPKLGENPCTVLRVYPGMMSHHTIPACSPHSSCMTQTPFIQSRYTRPRHLQPLTWTRKPSKQSTEKCVAGVLDRTSVQAAGPKGRILCNNWVDRKQHQAVITRVQENSEPMESWSSIFCLAPYSVLGPM